MPDIFLSYSREDLPTARRFAEAFEREGLSVWWDQTLNPGEDFDSVTENALHEASAVVVLWSRHSVTSRWVRAEATQARESKTLVPVMIEPCKRPIMFELTHTADLSHWKGDASDASWQSYLAGVRRMVRKDGSHSTDAPAAATDPSRPGKQRSITMWMGLGVAALAIAALGWWAMNRGTHDSTRDTDSASTASAPVAAGQVTLAVLPFANLSSDPEQEYFSDGLTEEILNQLAQVKELRLTGRTSSFAFKGKNEDLRVIGEKLGVANLLEGSVRKAGKELRITAQLINAADGTHRWSKTYERNLEDVFAVQEQIARDVASALSITLDVGAFSRAEGGTNNIEAYDKFLLATSAQSKLGANVATAARLYREATELDPTFWRAWFGLAGALGSYQVFVPDQAAAAAPEFQRVRAHLIASAPDSASKQVMLAIGHFQQREWAEHDVAVEAAQSKSPASAFEGAAPIALQMAAVGRIRESLELTERMTRAEPLGIGQSTLLQMVLTIAGRPADAEAEYQRSRGLEGDHQEPDQLSLNRLIRDPRATPSAVQARYRALAAIYPEMAPGQPTFDALTDPQAARTAIRVRLVNSPPGDPFSLLRTAGLADFVGDKDSALTALQRAATIYTQRPMDPVSLFSLWYPFRTQLRADPRFKEVVRELGLVNYWRTTGKWGEFCKPVGADDFECR